MALEAKPQQRILAVKLRALGDGVIATGALQALHGAGYTVDYLVPSRWEPAFREAPYLDRIIAVDEPRGALARFWFWLRTIIALRAEGYGAVAVLHASLKTALVGRLVSLGRGPCVVDHHRLQRSAWHRFLYERLLSSRAVPGRGVLKANHDRDLDPVRALGLVVPAAAAQPHLHVSDKEREEARGLLGRHGWSPDEPLLFLGIGASKPTKRWPAHHMSELVKLVASQDPRWKFVICTVPGDEEWLAGFKGEVITLKSRGLREAMAVLSLAQAYVGNDSGMKHVAAALGVPTVTVFGPEDPREWHPYDAKLHPLLFTKDLPCRTETGTHWCPLEVCVEHRHRCLEGITPFDVLRALSEALKNARRQRPAKGHHP